MRRRVLILPIAVVIIVALCVYKSTRRYDQSAFLPVSMHPVALDHLFELPNQHNETVRIERYVGRHDILLIFYDKDRTAAGDPYLPRLREAQARLKRRGFIVIGISTALPQENRKAGDFPFELLTDISTTGIREPLFVHRKFNRVDDDGRPKSGVFHINRAGSIAWAKNAPQAIPNPAAYLDALIGRE
ncbi:MAG: redoxin domain-containing protein [Planctomycetota bacterium]|nr:redoxin domain-containing protein [Planctomycetota bacterium]